MAERPAQDCQQQQLLRFVSDIVHDLVGPVDQVSSLVALFVRRYRGQVDNEAQHLLAHIESAGVRLSVTAAGLRSYFNVAYLVEGRRTRVPSKAVLDSAVLVLQQEIGESLAEVTFGELPDVEGDPSLLEALFHSLIQNSIKFRRAGIPPRVLVSAESSQGTCRFSIIDNGIGIDPQYTEEVFLAFRKLNGHSYHGAGMGLTIARAIVEAHGGKIWVTRSGETGTTVKFELPSARER